MESEYLRIKNNFYCVREEVAIAWLVGLISGGVMFTVVRQLILLLENLNCQKIVFRLNQNLPSNTYTHWPALG